MRHDSHRERPGLPRRLRDARIGGRMQQPALLRPGPRQPAGELERTYWRDWAILAEAA